MRRLAMSFPTVLLSALLSGCGGGGSTSTPTPPSPKPPPPPTNTLGITTTSLPGATAGVPYTTTLTAKGGTPPYHWDSPNPSTLPIGFTLSQDGVLSGTWPAFYGGNCCWQTEIRVTDSAATPSSVTVRITLNIFGLSPYPPLLPYPQVNVQSEFTFVAIGGVPPIVWTTSGTPPAGMTFQNDPADSVRQYDLVGTPAQAGTFQFSITITDSSSPPLSETVNYQLPVEGPKLVLPHNLLPPGVVGQSYTANIAFSGGTPPYSWSLSPTQLPPGFQFDNVNGVLLGTPTAPGYASFTVTLQDSSTPNVQRAQQYYWVLVTPGPLPPRNDSIANSTPIFPGTYEASISPYGDPLGTWAPDEDYYSMTAPAGTTFALTVWTYDINHFNHQSPLDPVVEIVDASGTRLTTCNDPYDDNPPQGTPIAKDLTPDGYDDPCMNHGGNPMSIGVFTATLGFRVPGTSGNETFYIHVFDYLGNARPDMFYIMTIQ